jgi:small GTP-binding protein
MISKSIKLSLFGESTVGKTTIANGMIYGNYGNPTEATIGVSFLKLHYNDINYEIWDTAGQERYFALTPMYFRNSHILMFVFDIDRLSSINVIDKYIPMLGQLSHYYHIFVIGNKTDLMIGKDIKEIEETIKRKFSKLGIANHVYNYLFVSAKTGDGFDILLDNLDRCAFKIKEYINTLPIRSLNLSNKENDNRQCICL